MENPNQALIQQNNFLASQNKLLEQINGMLMRQNPALQSNEIFIENIDRDEMRTGFLVTSHRKKLWNVQIGLIKEFDRICKKHNLKWFACGGTLLGAARHKGFIPWDDDVDVAMMRPEYNKFIKIASEEIKYPYFFDNWYNYTIESENIPEEKNAPKFQFISLEQEMRMPYRWFTQWPSFRLRDSRTTLIENGFGGVKTIHQGIWIDVFPFDIMPPFNEDKSKMNFEMLREILLATAVPRKLKEIMKDKQQLLMAKDELNKFLKLPYRKRGAIFDDYAEKFFFQSEKVGDIRNYAIAKGWAYDTSDFDELVYLPFETIEVPAPKNWDNVLKTQYGNWKEMKMTHVHTSEWSADIPYTEYYRTSAFMR